jgi:hypothetical protein
MLKAVSLVIAALACATAHPPPGAFAPLGEEAKALAPLWVGPAYSGTWYTPERSGEGWSLQILENGTALALWFTYPPAGSPGQQAWIYAQDGRLEGDRVIFDTSFTTRGPRFGPGFHATPLELVPWGTIEFRFSGCNDGELIFAGPEGWGSGTRRITRITELAELHCASVKRKVGAQGARTLAGLRQRSGLWFDPTHNGEGWVFEELPDGRVNFFWYTYDENGGQAWINGVAPASGDRLVIADNVRPVGTRFGAAFDAAQVNRAQWGRVEVDFDTCDAGALRYESPLAAFGSGTLQPVRVARLAGSACVMGAPGVEAGGTWSEAARLPTLQSEVATTSIGGLTYIAGGFGDPRALLRYNPAADAWTALTRMPGGRDHALATAVNGDLYVTGGYPNGDGDQVNAGWRYRVASDRWEALAELPQVAASGAVTLAGFAYFSDVSGDIRQYNPRTRALRVIHGNASAPRDHSQMVAFQGELWLMGGRAGEFTYGRVAIFDPASETWRAGPALNTPRAGFAAAASDTLLMIAGGEVLSNPPRVVAAVEAIAAGEDAWTRLPQLPTPVHGVGGAIHGNAFFALGGSTVASTDRSPGITQVYRWDP